MDQELTVKVTPEDLTNMVDAAVKREVVRRMPSENGVRQMIKNEVEHLTRTEVREILRDALPGFIESWLGAREGWVARLVTRAVRGPAPQNGG